VTYDNDIVSVILHVPHGDRLGEMKTWLFNNYGDRDYNLMRWKHHRKKGEHRKHWDYRTKRDDWSVGESEVKFRFGHRDMALMFKLAWGGSK
jgi:hypothetical protein